MLHITPEAGLAIQKLTRAQGVSEDGGLRMKARTGEQSDEHERSDKQPAERSEEPSDERSARRSVMLSVAALPVETDVVITEETTGARVMLDAVTADYVDNKTLDVSDTVESTARFSLSGQGTTTD
jgi:hypothetical protein